MDERVRATIRRVEEYMADKPTAWALPIEAAALMHALVLACRARLCVEIGTSYGYSGLWIGSAAAANGGKLLTLEIEAAKAEVATGFFREAGLQNVITCRIGLAEEALKELTGPVDWVLNDADKENCIRYVELLYPKLSVGGAIVTDNVGNQPTVRSEFVPWVRGHQGFFSTLLPAGNGMELSIKVQ